MAGAYSLSAPNGRKRLGFMSENSSVEEQQARLLGRVAAGDRSALAEFYDQLAPALFSLALRMLSDPQDAEEVIQDVFVQVWTKAGRFDPAIGLPFSWVMGITRNRCIDRLRARQRRARVMVEIEDGIDLERMGDGPADGPALGQDEVAALRSAIDALQKEQRQAIEMAFFGGLSHHEIAETLQEPLGTIKARIRRGMLKLRENLHAYI